MKKIISVILAVMLIAVTAMFCACNQDNKDDLAKIKEKGVINIGITNYKPMDYLDENNDWIGFDADLANEFGKELGVTVNFIVINWKQKVTELNSGYIDLIWNGMTADTELGEKIDFSVSYARNFQCAVIRKDNVTSITDVNTVKSATIAVESGSAGDTVASEELGVTPNGVNSQLEALNEVLSKTSQVAIIDYTMACSVVGKGSYADLTIVDTNSVQFANEVFAVGARKGSNLIEKLNEFFKKEYNDGSLAALSGKYDNLISLNEEALKTL